GLDRSGIMTTRIREQLERVSDQKSNYGFTIMAAAVQLPSDISSQSLEKQVLTVAEHYYRNDHDEPGKEQQRVEKHKRASN
ncbi:MAG: hypothetical protein WCC85_14995, partial [Candidatus Sulfotelmatobacter sp.]